MKLRPAAATFALLLAAACSHAPQPVTHKSEPANTAATAGPKKAPAAAAPVPHSSEAEPKAAAATTSTSAAAAPAGAAPSAAAMPAAAASSPQPISPLPPLAGNGSGPAAAGTSNAAGVGAAGVAAGTAAPAAAAKPSGTPAGAAAAGGAAAVRIPGPAAAGEAPRLAAGDPSLIVVDQPDYDPSSQLTLAQAAKAERERKAEAVPPRIVINNKTLHRYAKGGQLTVAEAKKKKDAASAPAGAAAGHGAGIAAGAAAPRPAPGSAAGGPAPGAMGGAGSAERERDERYWRGRALDIRERWRKAADRIKVLEQDVSEWRRRFYAQDDPWVRDGQIKPAWDRALVELRESRAAVVAAKKELADFQEEGRIAGALPGWLREGIDLEPKEEPPVDPTQAIETPIYKEPGPRR
jgi:hypothetical protein